VPWESQKNVVSGGTLLRLLICSNSLRIRNQSMNPWPKMFVSWKYAAERVPCPGKVKRMWYLEALYYGYSSVQTLLEYGISQWIRDLKCSWVQNMLRNESPMPWESAKNVASGGTLLWLLICSNTLRIQNQSMNSWLKMFVSSKYATERESHALGKCKECGIWRHSIMVTYLFKHS
jgi:hypothetical protein